MAVVDKNYQELINVILRDGFTYEDPNRKGINRIQIPSYKFEHNFKDGFPAITTKKLYWKGVVGELMWFLKGDTNIKYLLENKIPIWNKDAYNYSNLEGYNRTLEDFIDQVKIGNFSGDLGRIYGAQWRNWNGKGMIVDTDQISNLIEGLKTNPMSTRHLVTAWNPAELNQMALPPCHWSFEILVRPLRSFERLDLINGYVSTDDLKTEEVEHEIADLYKVPKYGFTLKWHQRSVDTFLGLPFNIASYALLAHIIGKMTNMIPEKIEGDLSNVHLYEPHLKSVVEQSARDVNKHKSCELTMLDEFHYMTDKELVGDVPVDKILNELRIDMFKLKGYESYPSIKAEMLAYNK